LATTTTLGARSRNGRAATRPSSAGKVSRDTLKELTNVFKMLADASRLRILLALARDGEMHVSALCEMLDQSQPAVSHHLTLMRMTGLVAFDRHGKHNFYRLASSHICGLVEQLFTELGNGARQIHLEDCVLTYKRK
jgi:DNA-binding transcriptional ArsR family regulator